MIFRRFFAFLIDKIIIFFAISILILIPGLRIVIFVEKTNQIYWEIILNIAWAISIPFYFSYFESSEMQGTPGKKLLNIKIVDAYFEDTLDGTTAFLRFIACVLINITMIGFIIIIIMMIFRKDGKMLHDIFLNTKIVRR